MKADMDAFLRPSVFKCFLVQVMAVLPLEQKPVCYPQGTAPALPPTPRPEGRGRLQLHTSQAQAAGYSSKADLTSKLSDF